MIYFSFFSLLLINEYRTFASMKVSNWLNFNTCQIRFPIWKYISNYQMENKIQGAEAINNTPRYKNMSNIKYHLHSCYKHYKCKRWRAKGKYSSQCWITQAKLSSGSQHYNVTCISMEGKPLVTMHSNPKSLCFQHYSGQKKSKAIK